MAAASSAGAAQQVDAQAKEWASNKFTKLFQFLILQPFY
jgi:hypothetical protein